MTSFSRPLRRPPGSSPKAVTWQANQNSIFLFQTNSHGSDPKLSDPAHEAR